MDTSRITDRSRLGGAGGARPGAPELVKAGDFTSPTYATAPPGDPSRVFVTERAGRVRIIRDGNVLTQPFLDVTSSTESAYQERGLLSAAFAPDYATSGRFYVYLTARAPLGEIQIWESRPDVVGAPSPEVLARGLRNPWRFSFDRVGGQLVIADVGQRAFEEVEVDLA